MEDAIPIARVTDIPPGEGRAFRVRGLDIAVFRLRGGAVYATQAACPHQGGPLADGLTGSGSVICPLHERVFDLESGVEVGRDCKLETFPVRVSGDGTIELLLPAR